MTRRAECNCGELRVLCEGEPERVSVCHCLACQRRTGSAFGAQARYRRDRISVEGRSSRYVRTGDSGSEIAFHFCAACGATVYWEPSDVPDIVRVAVGAFADPEFPAPELFVYEARRHAWAAVPTTPCTIADSTVTATRVAPVLPVRDVPAALDHYRRLGFTADAYSEPGSEAAAPYGFLHLGPLELHVARTPDLDPAKNTSACYLYVSDVDALHARWKAAAIPGRLDPPRDTPYGLRELVHIDPDGNLLRLGSPLPATSSAPR
jgi:hypothetical protein